MQAGPQTQCARSGFCPNLFLSDIIFLRFRENLGDIGLWALIYTINLNLS